MSVSSVNRSVFEVLQTKTCVSTVLQCFEPLCEFVCERLSSHCVRGQLEQRVAQLGMGLHGNGDIPLAQMTSGSTEVGIHQVHNLCQLRGEREKKGLLHL